MIFITIHKFSVKEINFIIVGMAEKFLNRLGAIKKDIQDIITNFEGASDISEEDLFDGDYFLDGINKSLRKLKDLSKNYENVNTGTASNQNAKSPPKPDGEPSNWCPETPQVKVEKDNVKSEKNELPIEEERRIDKTDSSERLKQVKVRLE